MPLPVLPIELILSIVDDLTCESDINALVRTNRRFYSLLNLFLYRYAIQKNNYSPLFWASYNGFISVVCMLIAEGASVRWARESDKQTALHLASSKGHLLVVEVLIQNGADVNAQSSTGSIPLHEAVLGGFEDVTRTLLENGADFMKTLPGGGRSTILHSASSIGNTSIVRLLLEKGMGIDIKDGDLQTPLHCAIKYDEHNMLWPGNVETVDFLLRHNANKEAWDKLGRRPKDLAKGHPSFIVELLVLYSPDMSLEEAILLDQQWQMRKEQEEAQRRKAEELAAQRAADRMARLQLQAERREERLRQKTEESTSKKSQPSRTRPPPCLHPALGWLKCKRRAQCGKCGTVCAKFSFICGDCGLVACLTCKTHGAS